MPATPCTESMQMAAIRSTTSVYIVGLYIAYIKCFANTLAWSCDTMNEF